MLVFSEKLVYNTNMYLTDEEIQKLKNNDVPSYRNIFPPDISNIYTNELVKLLGEANRAIGNLNSSKKIIPNPDLLVGPVLLKEALASSKIEGTQTTLRDVVQEEANLAFDDSYEQLQAKEVVNHMMATRLGIELVEKYSLTSRVFKEMHQLLLSKVRGTHTTLGDFRVGKNAIQKNDQIIYLPPDQTEVPNLMSILERYLNAPSNNDVYDPLLRAAITHYQFEAIHPFADGNGRLGRALISLQLIKEGVLRYPVLYLSGYLLKERKNYDECLLNVTLNEDWTGWITFFLNGIKEQATRSENIVDQIFHLYEESREIARKSIKTSNVDPLITLIFKKNAVSTKDVMDELHLSSHTAAINLLRRLVNLKLLSITNPSTKRNIHFTNEPLIKLLETV